MPAFTSKDALGVAKWTINFKEVKLEDESVQTQIEEANKKYNRSLVKLGRKLPGVQVQFASVENQIQKLNTNVVEGTAPKVVVAKVMNRLSDSMDDFHEEKLIATGFLAELENLILDNPDQFPKPVSDKVSERFENLEGLDNDMQTRIGDMLTSQQPDQTNPVVPAGGTSIPRPPTLRPYQPKNLHGILPTKLQEEINESEYEQWMDMVSNWMEKEDDMKEPKMEDQFYILKGVLETSLQVLLKNDVLPTKSLEDNLEAIKKWVSEKHPLPAKQHAWITYGNHGECDSMKGGAVIRKLQDLARDAKIEDMTIEGLNLLKIRVILNSRPEYEHIWKEFIKNDADRSFHTVKELLKLVEQTDLNNQQDDLLKQSIAKTFGKPIGVKPVGLVKKAPEWLTCFKCKENHFSTDCTLSVTCNKCKNTSHATDCHDVFLAFKARKEAKKQLLANGGGGRGAGGSGSRGRGSRGRGRGRGGQTTMVKQCADVMEESAQRLRVLGETGIADIEEVVTASRVDVAFLDELEDAEADAELEDAEADVETIHTMTIKSELEATEHDATDVSSAETPAGILAISVDDWTFGKPMGVTEHDATDVSSAETPHILRVAQPMGVTDQEQSISSSSQPIIPDKSSSPTATTPPSGGDPGANPGSSKTIIPSPPSPTHKRRIINIRISKVKKESNPNLVTCLIQKNAMPGVGEQQQQLEKVHPDTGASKSVVALNMIKRLGLSGQVKPTKAYALYNASNDSMIVNGTIKLFMMDVRETDGDLSEIHAIVSESMSNEFLLSAHDQKKIGILHEEWPQINLRQNQRDNTKKERIKKCNVSSCICYICNPNESKNYWQFSNSRSLELRKEEKLEERKQNARNSIYLNLIKEKKKEEAKEESKHPATILKRSFNAFLTKLEEEKTTVNELKKAKDDVEQKEFDTKTDLTTVKKDILEAFPKVFVEELSGERFLKVKPQKIMLDPEFDGHKRRRMTAKVIPLAWKAQADEMISNMLRTGLIVKADHQTGWVSSTKFVQKPSGALRMTIDYSGVNKSILRSPHHFPSQQELMKKIEPHQAKYLCKLDMKDSYHQVRLHPDSQDMTTFMTEWGSFKYTVMPQGLSCSGDFFNEETDAIFWPARSYVLKEVDDILIFAPNKATLIKRIREVCKLADVHGVSFSESKFSVGQKTIFAGFQVDLTGETVQLSPDPERIRALLEMEAPENRTELKSFLGMYNSLNLWHPDSAYKPSHLRELTSLTSNWLWTSDHQQEFEECKKVMCAPNRLAPFDPTLETHLFTDAAKLRGVGFILMQKTPKGAARIIWCGSSCLSPAQKRFSITELELLACVYAYKKTSYFLKGHRFYLHTDHQALLGLMQKDLCEIENDRLSKLAERLGNADFEMKHVKGEKNIIADCLSRKPENWLEKKEQAPPSPVSQEEAHSPTQPLTADRTLEHIKMAAHIEEMTSFYDPMCEIVQKLGYNEEVDSMLEDITAGIEDLGSAPVRELRTLKIQMERSLAMRDEPETIKVDTAKSLENLYRAGGECNEYQLLLKDLDSDISNLHKEHPLRAYTGARNLLSKIDNGKGQQLILVDGHKILVPASERKEILRILHLPHQGSDKTIKEARSLYHWSGMSESIKEMCLACQPCQTYQASQPAAKFLQDKKSIMEMKPMESVSCDNFELGGTNYLAMVDRFSGFAMLSTVNSLTTHNMIKAMTEKFQLIGYPEALRSDNATCFKSEEFVDWATKHHISLENSSPYNAAGNGLAERCVGQLKHLLKKCKDAGQDFNEALHQLNTMSKRGSPEPALLFLQRPIRNLLPRLTKPVDMEKAMMEREESQVSWRSTGKGRNPVEFSIGQEVLVQDQTSRKWDQTATIISAHEGDSGRSYYIKFKNGKESRRTGTFLKVYHPALSEGADRAGAQSQSQPTAESPDTASVTQPASLPVPPQPISSRTRSRDNLQHVTSTFRIDMFNCLPPHSGLRLGVLDRHAEHGGQGGGDGLHRDQEGGPICKHSEGDYRN